MAQTGRDNIVDNLSKLTLMARAAKLVNDKGKPLAWFGVRALPKLFVAAYPDYAGSLPHKLLAADIASGKCKLTPAEVKAVAAGEYGEDDDSRRFHALCDLYTASKATDDMDKFPLLRGKYSPVAYAVRALLPPLPPKSKGKRAALPVKPLPKVK